MSTEQKIQLFDILVDTASCYKNELRTTFGMMPLPELAGMIAMSSNKTNAENNRTDNEDNKEDNNDNNKNNTGDSDDIDETENGGEEDGQSAEENK